MSNQNNVKVSIIIPCYNASPYIAATIDCVLAQSYTNWECIIIDDYSTDNSKKIIRNYQQQFPTRIFVYDNVQKGVSSARNLALNIAKGMYIQFLDADDLIHPKKIELQMEHLQGEYISPSFICSNWARIKQESTINALKITSSYKPSVDNLPINFISSNNFIPLMSGIFLKTPLLKIGGFSTSMTHIEDVNLLIRLFKENNNFLYLQSEVPLFYYRNVPSSASNQNFEAFYRGVYTNCKLITKLFNIKQNLILFEAYWNIFLATSQIKSTDLTHKAILELKKFDRPFSLSKKYGKTYLISKLIGFYLTSKILYLKCK